MPTDKGPDPVESPAPAIPQPRWPQGHSPPVRVDVSALSHVGLVRPNNQDHFFAARFRRVMGTLWTNVPEGAVALRCEEVAHGMLVADGLGWGEAGEAASRMAVCLLVDLVLQTPDWITGLDDQRLQQVYEVVGRLDERFLKLNDALADLARGTGALQTGLHTTLTVACSRGTHLVLAHVGDSRAYLLRAGRLLQLTRDHTVAQTLVDSGVIHPEEAAQHPRRDMLTAAIGAGGTRTPVEVHELSLADGDQLLLATNGLTAQVSDEAVAEVLCRPGSADDACRRLIDLALEAGGKDNVTVVLARYHILEERR
jgi:protein phosphatase